MKFSELLRLLEKNGFRLIKEKGSIRYYGKANIVISSTLHAILKAAGIKKP
ncbi:MAG: type II toxin-antitoxin system HicA family toxin [Deltaproteobacteria bacterium]